MARNIPKDPEQNRPKEKARSASPSPFKLDFGGSGVERARLLIGGVLVLFSVFMFFSFFSHLFTGKADQSEIHNSLSSLAETGKKTKNFFGVFGAKLADLLVLRYFGVSAFWLVPMTFFTGVQIGLKRSLVNLERFTKLSIFGILWGSTFLGFWVYTFHIADNWSDLCGGMGYYLNEYMDSLMGPFTIFVILFLLILFISFFYGTEVLVEFMERLLAPAEPEAETNEEQNADDISQAKNIRRVRDDLENTAKNTKNTSRVPEPEFEDDDLLTREDNADEESIRPYLPPIVEAKANTPAQTISPASTARKEVSLTIENTLEGDLPETIDEIEEDIPVTETSKDEASDELVKRFGLYDPTLDLPNYQFPSVSLLKDYDMGKAQVSQEELKANSNKIVDTLGHYGIGIADIKATIGPTVTLYEIIPDAGVRISKIKNLEDDISLALAALGIRIIAPIPGKGTIGIEVPNKNREMVPVKMVIGSEKFQKSTADLPIVLGKTISNDIFMTDLAKMPHLLMAGATGQGKSVGLNMILTSLLYKKHPSQLKFVLVDPKKVELTLFNKIERHFLAMLPNAAEAIITDTKKVVNTLNSLCIEMDNRYNLLKDAGCRNLKEYNAKFVNRRLNPDKGHYFMPYIVLVVDELADLMMTAGKEVEQPIARLAQLARAIGIHLVIATQRPSVNVITGTIKANFPARLSFKVTSKIDSRTILDTGGAEQLVGMGDMLLSTGSDIIRLQCAFVDTPEVEDVCEYIGEQSGYDSAYLLPEFEGDSGGGNEKGDFDSKDKDEYFEEAARLIVTHQQGSTSLIQRRLKLGYNRAGRIIDQLEKAGVVGPFEGSKAREVYIKDLDALEKMLRDL